MDRFQLNQEFNNIFLREEIILESVNIFRKVLDVLPNFIKRRDSEGLGKVMKVLPNVSLDKLKESSKKRLPDFEENYKKSLDIIKMKRGTPKEALAFSVATVSSMKRKTPQEILESAERNSGRNMASNIIALVFALIFLARLAFVGITLNSDFEEFTLGTKIWGGIAILVAIKSIYNLAMKKAGGFFLFVI